MKRRFGHYTVRFVTVLMVLVLFGTFVQGLPRVTRAESQSGPDERGATVTVTMTQEEAELYANLKRVISILQRYYPHEVDLRTLYEGAAKGAVQALGDPYSQYIEHGKFDDFTSSLEGEFVGIGVTLELVNGVPTVVNTFPGSPARQAGIRAGDRIVKVNGQDVAEKGLQEIAGLIRGDEGTEVTLTLYRPSARQSLEVKMTRRRVKTPTLDVQDLGDYVWRIAIFQFTGDASRNFVAILSYLRSIGLKGLVLDLRDNPGGNLDDCIEIARALVPKGPIVKLVTKSSEQSYDNPEDPPSIVPIAVLVNEGSASAAEILACAIRERGVGILVGSKTFGKGTAQAVLGFGDGSGMKVTLAEYFGPNDVRVEGKGLTPDIPVADDRPEAPPNIQLNRLLRPGLIGLDVLAVQDALIRLGILKSPADGVFGPLTMAAVKEFQRRQGLPVNGQVNQDLADTMVEALRAAALDPANDPVVQTALEALRRKIATGSW